MAPETSYYEAIDIPLTAWEQATRTWVAGSERVHQVGVERLRSVIDDSHELALYGLATATSFGLTLQRSLVDSLERWAYLVTHVGQPSEA
jgi:hypothetical protein